MLFLITSFKVYKKFVSQHFGPKIMNNRKPFEIRKIIITYNLIQVLLNANLFYNACTLGWFVIGDHAYNWRCQPLDRSPNGIPLLVSWHSVETKLIIFNFIYSSLDRKIHLDLLHQQVHRIF